jgi:murein tripeptide amidase MpaA
MHLPFRGTTVFFKLPIIIIKTHSFALIARNSGAVLTSRFLRLNKTAFATSTFRLPAVAAITQSDTSIKHTTSNIIKMTSVSISDAFDGGNGKLNRIEIINGQLTVYVDIRKDPFTQLENVQHSQYFNFRSCIQNMDNNDAALNTRLVKYVLSNAGDVSFPAAWEGSTIFYSSNPWEPSSWRRKLDTTYDANKKELFWTHNHDSSSKGSIYFAYFPPYSYERHLSLISKCEAAPLATVESLGQTLDGREIECIRVGDGHKVCWIIHRQHPGETMAEFYAEGLLTRLLGLDKDYAVDGMVKDVLKMYTFYIVPNMCPDGAARGYLRTNAGGQNLNREWCSTGSKEDGESYYEAPTLERSPEVYHVLKKMDETGVDAFLDVHGDEALPFNFLAGSEGCPNWSDRLKTLHGAFLAQYSRTNSDMQSAIAYNPEQPGQGRMNVCSNQIAVRFDCLAATLEMPFKDCLSNPDPERGWNAARAAMLGASVLEPLAYVGPFLREEGELKNFGACDEYVRPTSDYKSVQ